jgi:hypothetical protein
MAEQNLNARNKFAADLIEMGKELAGRGVRPDDFEPLAACARRYVLAWYCTDTTERSLAPNNTDDIDTAEINPHWAAHGVERLNEQIARLREQLATVTAERDRLKLDLASTQFPTIRSSYIP